MIIFSKIKLKIHNKLIYFFLFFCCIFPLHSFAKDQNYCVYNSDAKELFTSYNVETYENLTQDQKNQFDEDIKHLPAHIIIIDSASINKSNEQTVFNGATEVYKNVNLGQRLIAYNLANDGQPIKVFDMCKPGCPKKGWLSSFFGSECIRGKAKGDDALFKNDFFLNIFKILETDKNDTSDENKLISKIAFLSKDLQSFSEEDNICVFSTLIEKSEYGNFTSNDESVFDKAFVDAVLKDKIPYGYKENITFYGVSATKEVRNFWRDIFSISKSNPRILSSICAQ